LEMWTAKLPKVRAWWARARGWPSFIAGVVTPLTRKEFGEMQTYGPQIHDEIETLLVEIEIAQVPYHQSA
jgi:hypothetical protein